MRRWIELTVSGYQNRFELIVKRYLRVRGSVELLDGWLENNFFVA
jgi:hypothetical protein